MEKGSLVTHSQNQHGAAKGGLVPEVDEVGEVDRGNKPRTYRLAFPARVGPRPFPVKECSCRAPTQVSMRMHFWYQKVRDTVVIM